MRPSPAALAILLLTGAVRVFGAELAEPRDNRLPELFSVEAALPTPESFLGYPPGARFTRHDSVLAYLDALAAAAPDRLRVVEYGRTVEGRPLRLAVVSSRRNLDRLGDLRERWRQIAAGAGPPLGDLPAAVWLTYGVHGNETSSTEAAMAVVHQLTAGTGEAAGLRDALVVLVDPLANPDGRERYLSAYLERRGARPNPDPRAAEHHEPWPGGRENHFLFDLNRDWAWATQAETRARLEAFREWAPQVHVDLHEMRAELTTYFFPPAAEPVNPRIGSSILPWLATFGRANGAAFDRLGWPYYVRETYDLFYPSYGDSYPSLRGGIGMTYEVTGGGAAGESVELEDGSLLELADRVARHVAASLATLRTAAGRRAELLESARERAHELASSPPTTYLWPRDGEGRALAELLMRHGARVEELDREWSTDAVRGRATETGRGVFPAGTYAVSTAQPLGNLLRTLLDPETAMPEAFLRAQRQRLELDRETQFYDITSWALPFAYDLEVARVDRAGAATRPATLDPGAIEGEGDVALVMAPQGLRGWRLVAEMLRRGRAVRVALDEFSAGSHRFPAGTMIFSDPRPGDEREGLADLARQTGVVLDRLASSGTDRGISLGSESTQSLRLPRLALVRGDPVDATGFGAIWHLLDAELGLPHLVIEAGALASSDLRSIDVLILPDGDYAGLDDKTVQTLTGWVKAGGLLVAIGGAGSWVQKHELSSVKAWQPPKPPAEGAVEPSGPPAAVAARAIDVPGAALATTLRPGGALTVGLARSPAVLFQGSLIWLPTGNPQIDLWSVDRTEPVLSGLVWPEAAERLRGALLMSSERRERGEVVLFSQDPVFRGFWRASMPLFLNSVLIEPNRLGLAAR